MNIVIWLVVIIVVSFDLKSFYAQDENLLRKAFCFPMWAKVLLAELFILSVFSRQIWTLSMIVCFLPLYIIRRDRLIRMFESVLDPELSKEKDAAGFFPSNKARKFLMRCDLMTMAITWFFCVSVAMFVLNKFDFYLQASNFVLWKLLGVAVYSFVVLTILVDRLSKRFSPRGFWQRIGGEAKTRSFFKSILVPIIVGLIFAIISSWILIVRDFQPQTPLAEALEKTTSSSAVIVFALLAVFAAPIVEEIIFRGYLYYAIKEVVGKKFSFCFVSVLFSVLHYGQYWQDSMAIAMVTILGFVLTYLRLWSQTTKASMVAHFTYNTGVIIIPAIIMSLSHSLLPVP